MRKQAQKISSYVLEVKQKAELRSKSRFVLTQLYVLLLLAQPLPGFRSSEEQTGDRWDRYTERWSPSLWGSGAVCFWLVPTFAQVCSKNIVVHEVDKVGKHFAELLPHYIVGSTGGLKKTVFTWVLALQRSSIHNNSLFFLQRSRGHLGTHPSNTGEGMQSC